VIFWHTSVETRWRVSEILRSNQLNKFVQLSSLYYRPTPIRSVARWCRLAFILYQIRILPVNPYFTGHEGTQNICAMQRQRCPDLTSATYNKTIWNWLAQGNIRFLLLVGKRKTCNFVIQIRLTGTVFALCDILKCTDLFNSLHFCSLLLEAWNLSR
jgi:hypothetical protein